MKKALSTICIFVLLISMVAIITLPAGAEHTTSLVNLYDKSTARKGHVSSDHTINTTTVDKHRTMEELEVSANDEIYFGPADTTQGFHLYYWDSADAGTRVTKDSTNLTVADTFDNGQVIYKYAVPGDGTVAVVNNCNYEDYFMVTKNQAMTLQDYFNYWDLQPYTNLYNKTLDKQSAYLENGAYKTNSKHNISHYIEVEEGDTITFGPADTTQGYHLSTFNSSKAVVADRVDSTSLKITDRISTDDSVIYTYTVPAGVNYVRLVNSTTYNDQFVVQRNNKFDEVFCRAMTGTDPVILDHPTENLYNDLIAEGGYIDASTNYEPKNRPDTYRSSAKIEVEKGSVLYWGAAAADEYQLFFWDSQGNPTRVLTKNVTKVEDIDDSTAIYKYTCPDFGYVRVTLRVANKDRFIITKNEAMDATSYAAYWARQESVLFDKSALFAGDSICYGSQDIAELSGWAGRIARDYTMTYRNNGVSGASLSTARENGAGRILWQVKQESSRYYDYVILHGGVNDAWDSYPVGTVSDSKDPADFDLDTYAGALEELFYYATLYHPTSSIGYIMNFKAPDCPKGAVADMSSYFAVGKQICEKWGIPYLDLYNNDVVTAAMTPYLAGDSNKVHPNPAGYEYLAPIIAEWMATLTPYDAHEAAEHEETVIACVGDSITKGERGGDINRDSYPAQLQELLGSDYKVWNFGWGGGTAQENTSNPYKNTHQYKQSRICDPDKVIIMLAANDSKSANWDFSDNVTSKAKFKADLLELVLEYKNMETKPEVYLALTPCTVGGGADNTYLNLGMFDAIREIAADQGCTLIDTYTPFSEKKTEWFSSDGVHPNATGYSNMAKIMYEAIMGTAAPSLQEEDTSVAETNEEMPLIRNFKKYPDATAYRIETVKDVEVFGDLISEGNTFYGKTVYLMNDLDFSGIDFKPLGATTGEVAANLAPLYERAFQGTFDGQFHTFSNVHISSMYYGCGLFPVLCRATIKNFGLASGYIEGFDVVGSIAGYADYKTKMYNVWSAADVYAANNGSLYTVQGSGGLASNTRWGGNASVSYENTGNPLLENVAYYGKLSACQSMGGLSAWGQNALLIHNAIFAGELDCRSKPVDVATFGRYSAEGSWYSKNLFGLEGEVGNHTKDQTVPTLLTAAAYTDGSAAYTLNAIDGAVWTVKNGYTIPWGDTATETHKITVGSTACYTGADGTLLSTSAINSAEYWADEAKTIYAAADWSTHSFRADTTLTALTKGDADASGELNLADVIVVLRYLVGYENSNFCPGLSDLNGNGAVTIYDAVCLLKQILLA